MVWYENIGICRCTCRREDLVSIGLERLVPKRFLQWLECGPAGRKVEA